MVRTSKTDPLKVASVAPPEGGGLVGITFCPGKCDLQAHNGPWDRDLELDLAAVRAWGAHALVTLLEDHEFERLGVTGLGKQALALGLEWHHLPIPDMASPGWRFERRWLYAGLRLRRLLRRGGRVLVHCRAGLGRAGTIAARLLAELGVPAAEAVSQVRQARPGAIQTADQERHVLSRRAIPAGQDDAVSPRLASLIGGALGDAFAAPVAADSLAVIRRRLGPAGLRAPQWQRGSLAVSAETQLVLFTLEGLVRALQVPNQSEHDLLAQIRLSYLDWLECQGLGQGDGQHASRLLRHAALHVQRSPAQAVIQAFKSGIGASPERPVNACRDGAGALRGGAVALMPDQTRERAFRLGARAAALSHGDPAGYLPAGILAAALLDILEGKPLQTAVLHACNQARSMPGHEATLGLMRVAIDASISPFPASLPDVLVDSRDSGAALAVGFYAASRSRDFREVLAIAANQDGASDVAASVAGQLFGAAHGIEALPHDWAQGLDVLDALCDLGDWALPLWRQAGPRPVQGLAA